MGSIIPTPKTRGMYTDIEGFYLNTLIQRYEYMNMKLEIILDEIVEQYNLKEMAPKGWIFVDIQKGVYIFPQTGPLESEKLTKH